MLDQFSEDQQALLIALPYRTGLWLSQCDSTGGGDADEAEMQALHEIVTGFAEDFLKSEFVQALMEQTVAHRNLWGTWNRDIDLVPEECRKAVQLLADHLDRKEFLSFKQNLMEIATDVALAYRENGDESLSGRVNVYTRLVSEKVRSMMTGRPPRSLDEILNISDAEQAALDRLAEALDLEGHLFKAREPNAA